MLSLTEAVLLGIISLLFGVWFQYRRRVMNSFKRLNIPGPEPHFLFGNLQEVKAMGPNEVFRYWTRKYGKTFGYFVGGQPVVVVADADILQQIMVKDFSKFTNRQSIIPGGLNAGNLFNLHLMQQRDQNWKNQRAILTPSFSSGKMKQMVPIVNEAIEEFLDYVGKHEVRNEEFDIYAMFRALTLDIIGRTAFGVRTEVQADPQNDDFLQAVQDVVREDTVSGLALLSICVPELKIILFPLRVLSRFFYGMFGKSKLAELAERCRLIIRSRRENPQNRRQDLLQLMLDAQLSKKDIQETSDQSLTAGHDSEDESSRKDTPRRAGNSGQKAMYYMNDDEVVSNIFMVLFTGYDTTSTALGFTTHVLVNRPDIQERIRVEILETFERDGVLNFTNVSRCKYLDQVFYESLRYYPPLAGFLIREASEDVSYGDLIIPKGTAVHIPISVHRDPDYWSDPDVFNPERFSPENKQDLHPLAFQAFGSGPRNCIGMRFAQMEAKLLLANLLLNYRLVPGNRTEMGEIKVIFKLFLMNPKNGVHVKVQKIDR